MESDFRFIDDRLAKFQLGSFNNPLFLRHNLARTLLTTESVKARLELKGYEADEIEKLVTYVTTKARIVFLTLVYLECLEHIKTLQDGGFTDQDLPVYERDREIDGNKEVFSWNAQRCPVVWSCFASLSARKQQNFCMDQWKFLAPNFKKANFPCQTIKDERPLPLMPAEGAPPTGGHFGMVTKALIPVEHQDYIDLNGRGDYPVAVKILAIREEGIDDHRLDYFFDREAKTLKAMSYLGTPHLIKFLLAFKQGIRGKNNTFEVKTRGFLFPWASGGNLSSFWMKESPRGQLDMLKWHLYQLRGLADAIMKLHALHTRHGDIKPANILLFDNLQPEQHTLVIADVGLAKVHEYYTRQRLNPTTTTHASTMQGPPETSDAETKFSRKYDVWSFGCVLFEFLVWAAFPKAEYKKFLEVFIKQKPPTQIALWVQTLEGKDLHPEVWKKAEELRDILKQHDNAVPSQLKPVLKQLLELVMTRLLVIDVEKDKRYLKELRADSKEMSAEMNKICNKRVLGNYTHSAPDLNGLTRTDSSEAAQGLVNLSLSRNYETSKLQDQWKDVTDNEVARRIASQLNWAPPSSDTEPPLPICDQCNTIDFRSNKIHISRDLETMRHSIERCTLCKLLYNTLSRMSVSERKSFQLFKTGSTLRVSNLRPFLTLYSGISLSPYAQVGLPQIPMAGSAREFALLGEFIRLCNDTHNCTSQQRDGARIYGLPTRLIDVGEGDNAPVHLIVKPSTSLSDITSGRYAALSHCWGEFSKNSESCLLKENLRSFQNRIAVEKLPKMFQDAIKATRGLKLRYLWLDSLCIIQDDDGDWASEAKRMEDVYCSAYVTLAASSAKSVYEGFLDRSSRRQWSRVPDTPDGPLYVAEMIDDFQTDVEKAVLSTRAWVLQERALSRRTIHFTSTQVYWECGQGVHCETLAQLRNPISHFLGDHEFPKAALSYFKDDRIRFIQYLYTRYSELFIKYETDRPVAISSLEAKLSQVFGSKVHSGVFEKFFERTILWRALSESSLTRTEYSNKKESQGSKQPPSPSRSRLRYPKKIKFPNLFKRKQVHLESSQSRTEYSSNQKSLGAKPPPSWSCLAYSGKIKFLAIPFGEVDWTGDLKNPFSSPDGKVTELTNFIQNITGIVARARKMIIKESEIHGSVTLDTEEIGEDFRRGLWRCITVGRDKTANIARVVPYYVLLIRPVPSDRSYQSKDEMVDETLPVFQRVGVGVFYDSEFSKDTENVWLI